MSELLHVGFDGAVDDDDAILNHTKRARLTVLDGIMVGKPASGLSDKEIANLAKMADGLDKQILTKKRLDVASQGNEKIGDLANVLNNLVIGQAGVKITRHDDETPDADGYSPTIPDIPDANFIAGELSPVGETIDVDTIIREEFNKTRGDGSQ